MSEEKEIECNQENVTLKMICEIEKLYNKNFEAQVELFKIIVPKALVEDKKDGLDERSTKDPFTFMLDFLGRGNDGRNEIAKNLLKENNEFKYENVLFLGIQNLTRAKFSHLKKETIEDCNNGRNKDIQECLKSIFCDNNKDNCLKDEPDIEELKKIFVKPTSTVTSVLYWLYPKQYIPFDKNSKKLYEKLELKKDSKKIKIEETWGSYNNVLEALKKMELFKGDDNKLRPLMIIALSHVAWIEENQVENILDKFIDDNEKKPKNIILTGIPGTGKTYSIMEYLENNKDTIGGYEFVQFHPSYDYEDFIEGLKPIPSENGQIEFKLVDGVFKELCKKAYKDKEKTYVMVIDEINRANLSRVFGELLYCLEYRDEFVSTKMTTYIQSLENGDDKKKYSISENEIGKFAIPSNVIILGTMNEIDRSIDAFDLALRRRFIWEDIGFSSTTLRLYRPFFTTEKFDIKYVDNLIDKAEALNKKLVEDIGVNYQLGHTYYFKIIDYFDGDFDSALCDLWEYHIKSIVREYSKIKFGENEIENKLKNYKEIIVGKNSCDG